MFGKTELIHKRRWLLPFATVVGVLSTTSAAKAATLSYSHTTTTAATDFTDTYTFPKFNSSLGTLQSVEVDLSGTVQGGFSYTNPTAKKTTITVGEQATVDLNESANGTNLAEVIPLTSQQITIPAGKTSGSATFSPISQSTTQVYTDPGTLGAFIGGTGSTISLDFSAAGQTSYTGPGTFTNSFNVQAGGLSGIIYTYSASPVISVPEPSNLMGLGLFGGVGLMVLKKRQKQPA